MERSARMGVLALVIIAVAATQPLTGATTATGAGLSPLQSDIDPDGVLVEIRLLPDGTARFSIQYRIHLDNSNRSQAFDSIRDEIRSNPDPYRDRFRAVVTPAVRQAENSTNRQMSFRNLSVTTGRQVAGDVGYITYTAEWTNFADRSDRTLRAGDAIAGFYLDPQTTLLVTWPTDYQLTDAAPMPDETRDRAVVWHGEQTFASTEPRISVRSPGGSSQLPVVAVTGVGLGVMTAVGAVVFVIGRRRQRSADPSGTDPSLLSNEERVLGVLERHGGRLRQQELAAQLDWTDPKTSRVVNALRDDGSVDVFRLGRENVVSLPEYDDEN